MVLVDPEPALCAILGGLNEKHGNRFTPEARRELLYFLFLSLVGFDKNELQELFGNSVLQDDADWNLSAAQGSFEGSEYSEQARGKRCGHIFKSGEATYRCKTCATDDTCVLCSKCFAGTDHTGHQFLISISPGNSGCCDCGDEEAWAVPLHCSIHDAERGPQKSAIPKHALPEQMRYAVKVTIGMVFDFLCDIISCAPEHMRLPKTEDSLWQDGRNSWLDSKKYSVNDDEPMPEYALVLWNDEKHSVKEVREQVARACKQPKAFGQTKATETDDVGRSVLMYDRDPRVLLKAAAIIEKIKITVTIRTARDTFRERMCGVMIEWLLDICGCRLFTDGDILKNTVCEEMLKTWVPGSRASNAKIGRDGLYDHEIDGVLEERAYLGQRMIHDITIQPNGVIAVTLVDQGPPPAQAPERAQVTVLPEAETTEEETGSNAGDQSMDLDAFFVDEPRPREITLFDDRAMEDPDETDEATIAGYPPPPPPPPPPPAPRASGLVSSNISQAIRGSMPSIPKTPQPHTKETHTRQSPTYWIDRFNRLSTTNLSLAEDVRQRVRLDWLVLWDLRMWKKARIDLRSIYIQTLVAVPRFKRILGLRFAGLYPLLAQLYLIADREPDHSIVYLSLQVITTPSVTKEVVEKGNFMTNLFAVLFTFLTTRQVGHPWDVNPAATLAFETGSVTNRRMYHFFMDIKHLLSAEYIQEMIRKDDRYVLQFLDLIRLGQGTCPNVRAVGEHVEYETDTWISASLLTRELNRLCRMFSDAFKWNNGANYEAICRVMKIFARAAILNSMGADIKRGDVCEITSATKFKTIHYNYGIEDTGTSNGGEKYTIVDFTVETGSISFHHPLQYMLSWIIECGKSLSAPEVRSLLSFTSTGLKSSSSTLLNSSPETYLMAVFDFPLRVCSWLSQMKAQMWVRNGQSLRHQMLQYRAVGSRDLAYQRDVFLLQTAVVICNPGRVLLSMVDRFGMLDWMAGRYELTEGFELSQMVDVAEDFIHLLLVMLTERTALVSTEEDPTTQAVIRRDIIHTLCFKPLSFSDLCNKLADKYQELEDFQDVLDEMTKFKPPEGLNDTGTFELKSSYLSELDPYIIHYSKNQRDEAEATYRKWVSKNTGKAAEDVVVEPKVRPIKMGLFQDIGAFSRTDIFAQIVLNSLKYAFVAKSLTCSIPTTRIETFLQVVLHLMLAAIQDDSSEDGQSGPSFISNMLHRTDKSYISMIDLLHELLAREDLKACHPKIHTTLARAQQRRPLNVAEACLRRGLSQERFGTDSPMSGLPSNAEAKKKAALERQRKVMAQFQQQQEAFMSNQEDIDWGEDEFTDDEATNSTEQTKKIWKYPAGNCILCQEETNDSRLYGTFGLLIKSHMIRQTDLNDPRHVDEVTGLPDNLDRSAENVRPYGISGQNHITMKKTITDGTEVEIPYQTLSQGWNPEFARSGTMSTGCGHVMHWNCFETYCKATDARHAHQIAREHPESIKLKEFVCPLCKALGNTFLPIIWKGKEESYPGVLDLANNLSLDAFLATDFAVKLGKHSYQADANEGSNWIYNNALFASLANELRPDRGAPSLEELGTIYDRLRATIGSNNLPSRFFEWQDADEASMALYSDVLPAALGYSISATEIAQRGVECDTNSILLDKISTNTLTHLRILSETASSYIVLSLLRSEPASFSKLLTKEVDTSRNRQLWQLFWGFQDVRNLANSVESERAALMEDPFILLTEASLCLAPALDIGVHHMIQLCYILELVKAIIGVQCSNISAQHLMQTRHTSRVVADTTESDLLEFRHFLTFVEANSSMAFRPSQKGSDYVRNLYGFVAAYALPYLRKCAILLHVRYGVDFPKTPHSDVKLPELVRLTRALRLPTLPEIFSWFRHKAPAPDERIIFTTLQAVVSTWISQWRDAAVRNTDNVLRRTRMSHPGIFELIGLPQFYDTLLDEMMRRRCPNTKREMVEPVLCLFCGDIFCSQAVCCSVDNRGGCNQHLEK